MPIEKKIVSVFLKTIEQYLRLKKEVQIVKNYLLNTSQIITFNHHISLFQYLIIFWIVELYF